ncbi:hypothetical protein UAM5_00044 [Ralstonia phage UAM5]|nr:hypothetical protein UAM5_00044 [Ralstonia phage UAM5]
MEALKNSIDSVKAIPQAVPPEVPLRVGEIEASLNALHNAITDLNSRLEPVLRFPADKEEGNASVLSEGQSPLGDKLARLNESIVRAIIRVNDATLRLEV